MQPSILQTDFEQRLERRAAFRTAFVDGRLAELVMREGKLPVRLLDESTGGFRVVTEQVCSLPDQSRTTLELEGYEVAVRLIYKRVEGSRTMIGLQRLSN